MSPVNVCCVGCLRHSSAPRYSPRHAWPRTHIQPRMPTVLTYRARVRPSLSAPSRARRGDATTRCVSQIQVSAPAAVSPRPLNAAARTLTAAPMEPARRSDHSAVDTGLSEEPVCSHSRADIDGFYELGGRVIRANIAGTRSYCTGDNRCGLSRCSVLWQHAEAISILCEFGVRHYSVANKNPVFSDALRDEFLKNWAPATMLITIITLLFEC